MRCNGFFKSYELRIQIILLLYLGIIIVRKGCYRMIDLRIISRNGYYSFDKNIEIKIRMMYNIIILKL